MELLFETDKLYEFADGSNRSFCMKDNGTFSVTDYRVMQGYSQGGLIHCEKVNYNGKVKLLYFTSRLKRLGEVVPYINDSSFFQLISDFVGNLLRMSENGFFECGNLLLDGEHIMVDESRMKIMLMYLPVEQPLTSGQTFGGMAKEVLAKTAQAGMMLSEKSKNDFLRMLSETGFSLEGLHEKINSRWMTDLREEVPVLPEEEIPPVDKSRQVQESGKKILVLETVDNESREVFRIFKDSFVIGRKEGAVDGVISGHMLVSRRHCRILHKFGGYLVEDLNSQNGTFVNGERVTPGNSARLEQGMLLRVADVSFRVDYMNG